MTTAEIPGARLQSASSTDRETDYRWLVRVWALVGAFVLVTWYWSHHVGIPVKDPKGAVFLSRIAISLAIFVPMTVIDASLRVGRREWTVRKTIAVLRERWTRHRLA
ncbi:MAG: PA-phosphatase, partial [Marmoricola sp.]|nr:PA-phosphatase [Marmoricola sp.]